MRRTSQPSHERQSAAGRPEWPLRTCFVLGLALAGWMAPPFCAPSAWAAGPTHGAAEKPVGAQPQQTPEETMRKRFPQPVRVGDLIGLRVLDYDDLTIGRVQQVVRTPAGKVELIVPYGGLFGLSVPGWRTRPVAVPIETVAILGRQIAALDMQREEFATAPTWSAAEAMTIAPGEMIQIAITRR